MGVPSGALPDEKSACAAESSTAHEAPAKAASSDAASSASSAHTNLDAEVFLHVEQRREHPAAKHAATQVKLQTRRLLLRPDDRADLEAVLRGLAPRRPLPLRVEQQLLAQLSHDAHAHPAARVGHHHDGARRVREEEREEAEHLRDFRS